MHAFFVMAGDQCSDFTPEPGLTVSLVTPAELKQAILSGQLAMQLHCGIILQAVLRGHLSPELKPQAARTSG